MGRPCVNRTDRRLKDLGLYVLGFAGIVYQTLSGHVEPLLLATFILMAGVPGAENLISVIQRAWPTSSRPSSSASERPRGGSDNS